MMNTNYTAPWHRASFAALARERLPELLAARGPLIGYRAEMSEEDTCALVITLAWRKNIWDANPDISCIPSE